jgi:cytoskeletal protein RodZ
MTFSMEPLPDGDADARDQWKLTEPILLQAEAQCAGGEKRLSLGQIFAGAREQRGLTQEQAAHEANVSVPYLKMIECGDYSAIPDMLYLLPFFQRYAKFLGLDVKEVTACFVRDFEAAESGAGASAAPSASNPAVRMRTIPWQQMVRALPWARIAQVGAIGAVAILIAGLAFAITRGTSQRTTEISPNALTQLPPPVRVKAEATPIETSLVTDISPAIGETAAPAVATKAGVAKPLKTAQSANAHRHLARRSSMQHRRPHHHRPG